MREYCENPLCENKSIKEVPVSVRAVSDQARALCAVCEEAYTWGVQHGIFKTRQETLWLLAVADRGLVAHVGAYSSQALAEKSLVEYLRKYEGYGGPDDIGDVCRWLEDHDERLSVDIVEQKIDSRASRT